jgi:rare lipoprotein A
MITIRGLLCIALLLGAFLSFMSFAKADTASYYGRGERLNYRTANGEVFRRHALTAAHRTLPFGSVVRVTNLRNGRAVVVRINDRGPAKWTRRAIDLSYGAASVLGMLKAGVVPVRIERIS